MKRAASVLVLAVAFGAPPTATATSRDAHPVALRRERLARQAAHARTKGARR